MSPSSNTQKAVTSNSMHVSVLFFFHLSYRCPFSCLLNHTNEVSTCNKEQQFIKTWIS